MREKNDDKLVRAANQLRLARAVAYYRDPINDRHLQQRSVSFQRTSVRQFADEHGLEIIKEFVEHGRPGLTCEDRDGLSDLMENWVKARDDFHYVHCADVGRWGRFQGINLPEEHVAEYKQNGKQLIFTSTFGEANQHASPRYRVPNPDETIGRIMEGRMIKLTRIWTASSSLP